MDPCRRAGSGVWRSGRTIVDVLVLSSLLVVMLALMPVLLQSAGATDTATQCLAKAKALNDTLLAYAADHQNLMPGDDRDTYPNDSPVEDALRNAPEDQAQYEQSWLAKVDAYAPQSSEALKCPVVDDHRQSQWWPTDYVINRWAINTSPSIAQEPSRAVLVAEPNMARGTVTFLAESIAWLEWGDRQDLEQNQVGSLSFGFVDGHAERITIAGGDNPHMAAYPQIFMAQPGTEPYDANYLWWTEGQELPSGQ